MKKIFKISVAIMLLFFSIQQLQAYNFTVSGQVLQTGQLVPAPDQQVNLHIMETAIFETTMSGEDGTYAITVGIPDTGSFNYFVKVFDYCENVYIIRTGEVTPEGAVEDFVICEGSVPGCEADFTWHQSNSTPLKVYFEDKSDFQPGTWYWEFGDGETSTFKNPFHIYAASGEYTVTLTINGADPTCVDTYSELVMVEGGGGQYGCEADFNYNISWQNPMEVHFHDMSDFQPGTWYWEFGDGETSNFKHPSHTYSAGGEYTVTLTINGADSTCVDSHSEVVVIEEGQYGCEADFTWHQSNSTPLKVYFEDKSDFLPGTWYWEFGDGETSTFKNPFHIYSAAGEYTVTLTINGPPGVICFDTYSELVMVEGGGGQYGCEADFNYNISWQNPMEVHFHDKSDFQPGTWYWEFGDGETSNFKHPSHTYSAGGEYTVTLTINGADSTCFDTYSESIVILDSISSCQANFWWHQNCPGTNPLEIQFINNSYAYGQIIEFAWDFGDGATSIEEDPIHVFGDFGLYNVTLGIVTESGCTSNKTFEVWVNDPSVNCMAMFVPFIDSINPLLVTFQDLSLGNVDEWLYDFGDGTTSNEQNPIHIYPEAAVYTASLTIEAGNCTSSFYYEIDLINGQVVVSPAPTTGINESVSVELSLYPNPVEDVLFINTNSNADITVRITNLAGQVLITTNQKTVDVSGLAEGIYFANININGQIVNSKFIK